MGAYVNSTLGQNERVLYEAHFSKVMYIKDIFLCLVIIGFFTLIADLIRQKTTEMVITNKRIVVKTGLISRNTFDNRLSKVEGVEVNQGFLGRIFGYGSVTVRGIGISHLEIPGIASPIDFKNAFNSACDEAESK